MNLLMISGDRSMLAGKRSAFWYTLEEFSKRWNRIDVICPFAGLPTQNVHPDALTFFGNVHFHPSPWSLHRQSEWIVQKGEQLARIYHHAVMTIHDYPPFYNSVGARRLLKCVPMGSVLEVHHVVGYPKPADMIESIGRLMSRVYLPRAMRSVSAVRVVSKSTAEILYGWGVDRRKVHVVPSFYLDHSTFAALRSVPIRYDVVCCARLVRNKAIDRLLRAMAKIPKASLLVIGDGPERQRLEQLARQLDIHERVEFSGWLDTQQDVLLAMKSAKIFVMNSLSEGGPRIALEAMACGLPVISTRVGIMTDVIEDGKNGCFVDAHPADIAAAIVRLLTNEPLRRSIADHARMILDRFERKKLIEQYARFLQSFAVRP